MTDSELIRAARGGDREAFGALVARHQGRVFALCLKLAGNGADAEDLAHDALVEAWLKLGQLRDPAAFGGWLRAVTLNVFRMWYRRRRETVELPEALPAREPDVDRERLHARLARGLFALSSPHRVVLVLHYLEGLSYEEIASLLDLPMGTVMSRLYRGRRALESVLSTDGFEEKTMDPSDTTMTQDVLAEIAVPLELHRERPEDAERLSVILERSPERLGQLVARAPEAPVLEAVGSLLPRLGAPAARVVLDAALAEDVSDEAAAAARTVLRAAAARYQTLPWGGGPDATADPDAYVLADALVAHPAAPEAKVALLLDLLDAVNDTAVGELFVDLLLAWPRAATGALVGRYRALASPADLTAGKEALAATCRTGTPFARALLADLSGADPARRPLALAGAEALARGMDRAGGEPMSPRAQVLEARHGSVVPPEAVDPAVLEALAAAVTALAAGEAATATASDRAGSGEAGLREAAIRTLGALRAGADTVRAALSDSDPAVRLAAIRATALVSDAAAADSLAALAADGEKGERAAAVEALGAVKAASAEPLLSRLLDDADRAVQVAAVSALGELGSAEAQARLREVMASGPVALRKAAAKALYRGGRLARGPEERRKAAEGVPYRGEWRREGALMSSRLWDRLRGEVRPVVDVSVEGALRWGLPELRPYDEAELSRRVGEVCVDVSSVRRKMVEQGLVDRGEGVYTLTPLGEAVWRVEQFMETAA